MLNKIIYFNKIKHFNKTNLVINKTNSWVEGGQRVKK